MKEMKDDKKLENICLGILIGAAVIVVAICMFLTTAPVKRTTKAVKYDLECIAGRSQKPLTECKEKSDD